MARTTISGSMAGSTLIEMMAVMLIIAMLASLVVATVPGTGRGSLKALTLQNRSAAATRATCGDSHRAEPPRVARRQYAHDRRAGRYDRDPRDVRVDVIGVNELWSGRQAVVRFEPDGASTGSVLKFSWENVRYEVDVNWLQRPRCGRSALNLAQLRQGSP